MRRDVHRVEAIIPEDYEYVLSYSMGSSQGGWPVPSWKVNCELDRRVMKGGAVVKSGEHDADGHCCVVGLRRADIQWSAHGGTGKCTVCGASFNDGDVWRHKATGEYIHVGHNCADKYNMIADRRPFDRALAGLREATAAARLRALADEEREAFLARHPGLKEDLLLTGNKVIASIAERFDKERTLSDATVQLVRKLANEVRNPPTYVTAPKGRTLVRGEVVSIKLHGRQPIKGERDGRTWKLTVRSTTPQGVWLAWGACPREIVDAHCTARGHGKDLKGAEVEFSAVLVEGREPHFARITRPTKARIIDAKESTLPSKAHSAQERTMQVQFGGVWYSFMSHAAAAWAETALPDVSVIDQQEDAKKLASTLEDFWWGEAHKIGQGAPEGVNEAEWREACRYKLTQRIENSRQRAAG